MVEHTFNPSVWKREAETGRSLRIPGQPGLKARPSLKPNKQTNPLMKVGNYSKNKAAALQG